MLVKCGPDTLVNPAHISTIKWDRSSYHYGSRPSMLVITMMDGRAIRLSHQPHMLDGIDCYLIEAKLMEAAAKSPEATEGLLVGGANGH